MLAIGQNEKGFVEEHLFGLTLAHAMLIRTFAAIVLISLETGNVRQIEHGRCVC